MLRKKQVKRGLFLSSFYQFTFPIACAINSSLGVNRSTYGSNFLKTVQIWGHMFTIGTCKNMTSILNTNTWVNLQRDLTFHYVTLSKQHGRFFWGETFTRLRI